MTLRDAQIIIPLGDGRLPLRVARCLGDVGARFILISRDRQNVARWSRYCTRFVHAPDQEDGELLETICRIENPGGRQQIVLPVTTEGFQFVSRNSETLSERFRIPPVADVAMLTTASDKWQLHNFATKHNIPMLKSILLSEIDDKMKIEFPALIKTRTREGGSGFRKVNSADELEALKETFEPAQLTEAFVQRFVTGVDVSLSVYCENGNILSYSTWEAVNYGRKLFQIPECIRFKEQDRALEMGQRLLRLLNWQGVCDLDFFMDSKTGELWLLEMNARFWGNVVSCAAAGVNFPELLCESALGISRSSWPAQTDGYFCFPKGLPRAIGQTGISRQILRQPLRWSGIGLVAKDLGPELYKLFLKFKRFTEGRHPRNQSNGTE